MLNIKRLYLFSFSIIIAFLFYYQILKGDYFYIRSKNNYIKIIPTCALRGKIFDRNSNVCAYDDISFNIAVIPYQVKWVKDIFFKDIAKLLNCNENILHKNYKKNFQNYFTPTNILIDINKIDALKLKESFGENIIINTLPKRFYVYPYEFAHLLGYVKEVPSLYLDLKYGYNPNERIGLLGIEEYYNDYLAGKDGGDLVEVNAKGEIVGFIGRLKPKNGNDIYLTIDKDIQILAYKLFNNRRGALIFMDSNTGEIIALVSSPSFNPNNFVLGKNIEEFLNNKDKPLINRAIQSTYPLGSTFKPIIATAALEKSKITPNTTFFCKGKIKIADKEFKCLGIHGKENIYEAIMHSCNIYFYNLGLILGIESIIEYIKKFSLNNLTGIDLPYEKKSTIPLISEQKKWFLGDTINLSIGQGALEVNPLKLTIALNTFANGGFIVKPYIVKKQTDIKREHIGVSKETLEIIKKGLILTVENKEGTAHLLNDLNLKIAGKTGTAQTKSKAHGWFFGFFPYDKPKYTICVFLENIGTSHEAVKLTYDFLFELKNKNLIKND